MGEPFVDCTESFTCCEDQECWLPNGEEFIDLNNNSIYDFGEEFIDSNGNNEYDEPMGNGLYDDFKAYTIQIADLYDVEDDSVKFSISPIVDWVDVDIDSLSGEITIKSIENKIGEGDFIVSAIDIPEDGLSVDKYFTLQINSINDSPEFNYGICFDANGDEVDVSNQLDCNTYEGDWNEDLIFVYEDFDQHTRFLNNLNEIDGDNVTFRISEDTLNWAEISIDEFSGDINVASIPDAIGEAIFYIYADDGQGELNSISNNIIYSKI